MPALDPTGNAVPVGPVLISSPGLTGTVEIYAPTAPGMRDIDNSSPEFLAALDNAGVSEQFTLEISNQSEIGPDSGGSRAVGGGTDITIQTPGPGDGYAQVVLYTAEDGSISWHFPQDIPPAQAATRGGDDRTYTIPRVIPPTTEDTGDRGLFGAVGKKLIKVLSFFAAPLIGGLASRVAQHWESSHHLDFVRTFPVDAYTKPGAAMTADQWQLLTQGRALLFVHGTFSRSFSGFGTIPVDVMKKLSDHYGGRVFAFDHSTVSVTPEANAAWFLAQIPDGAVLDIDVISHSRGGLVARALARLAVAHPAQLTMGSLVMVASPNAGTALADTGNIGQFLNRYTALFQLLPDNAVTDSISILLALVQQVALDAFGGLDGLTSMSPTGPSLIEFNAGAAGPDRCYAVASNYEPPAGSSLASVAKDGVIDAVFGQAQNDLVVPTDGAYTVTGAAGFPITNKLVFPPEAGVSHSTYWPEQKFTDQLLAWLTGPPSP